jgi:hypothetical protein
VGSTAQADTSQFGVEVWTKEEMQLQANNSKKQEHKKMKLWGPVHVEPRPRRNL